VFLHFAVRAPLVQAVTPFPLETWHGEAVVTLVAFSMRRMRFARWERLSEVLLWPFREQLFLNLRTYVRVGGEPGITFLAEWISSWIQAQLGPRLYGLPYRWGRHEFAHDPVRGRWTGRVVERGRVGGFEYRLRLCPDHFAAAAPGSFEEFALERHTCFLGGSGPKRCFRIWHPPWPLAAVEAEIWDDSLLRACAPWWSATRFLGGHVSPGVTDVWMGRPLALP
jgi:hypothetical protein